MKHIIFAMFSVLGVAVFGKSPDPVDFASKCASLWTQSDPNSLNAVILPDLLKASTDIGMISCWSKIKFLQQNAISTFDPKVLSIRKIIFRDPDQNSPRKVVFSAGEEAEASTEPDKNLVVYLNDSRQTVRVVLFFSLVQRGHRWWIVPMKSGHLQNISGQEVDESVSINGKDISKCPGVIIVKTGEDRSSYGFLPPEAGEKADRVFRTDVRGCTLAQVLKETLDRETWSFKLDYLPKGRFNVFAALSQTENLTINQKVQNAIQSTFSLRFTISEKFAWNGYRVTIPQKLPAEWKKSSSKDDKGWIGNGSFRGYTIKEVIYHAIPNEPVEIVGALNEEEFDLTLDVWPEAGGEMEALKEAGIVIEQITIPHRTVVISKGHFE